MKADLTEIVKTEKIICPTCEVVQDANITHTDGDPPQTYVHTCFNCGTIITKSDWQKAKTK